MTCFAGKGWQTTRRLLLGTFISTTVFAASAHAEATKDVAADDGKTLRICASANDAPFSTENQDGLENRIAKVVADEMGREPVFVWSKKPAIYQVRDQLDKNECDLVTGVDADDERVLTSEPYYRSAYVFVSKADRNLDIATWTDDRMGKLTRFAMAFGSPAEVMLRQIGMSKYEDNAAYIHGLLGFKSRRNEYLRLEPSKMVSEVANGGADMAIAFGPEVARYVKTSSVPLTMTVISNDQKRNDGEPIPHHFSQSMGVRKGDEKLLVELNGALTRAQDKILNILEEEGVPLVKAGS